MSSIEQLRYEAGLEAYVISVEPLPLEAGDWAYVARYPELPGVNCVERTVLLAIDGADRLRDEFLRACHERGEEPPKGRYHGRPLVIAGSHA
jgi:predicted RNase H-like HicB family nuclease